MLKVQELEVQIQVQDILPLLFIISIPYGRLC